VQLVRRGGWVLLVLQGLLVVVEGERKMWVDHNTNPKFVCAQYLKAIRSFGGMFMLFLSFVVVSLTDN
jgi:hypothetical protein